MSYSQNTTAGIQSLCVAAIACTDKGTQPCEAALTTVQSNDDLQRLARLDG
jgi:hypothetical protein